MGISRFMPISVIWLASYLIFCAMSGTDCSTFHVSFLGRNESSSTAVGILFIKTTGSVPVISHMASTSCAYSTSDWGLSTGFKSFTFDSTECLQLIPNKTEVATKGIKVESSDNFTLHVVQTDSSGAPGDGYLAIPDEHLGNEYYIMTYCSTGGICQFAVAGVVEETVVDITLPSNTNASIVCVDGIPLKGNISTGTAIPFRINEFDVIHFESEQDLSGTFIHANNKIAVFVGSRGVPKEDGSFSEFVEQIPSINKWGSEFVVVPNYLNEAGDIVKIITKTDNTVIHILGFSPFIIPNAGEAVERRIDWQMHSTIHASNPVLIVQVMNLNLYNCCSNTGSAAIVLVQHTEQWVDTDEYFPCQVSALSNDSLISVASDSYSSNLVYFMPGPVEYYSPLSVIDGSSYDATISKPIDIETRVGGTFLSSYGYCEGKYAMLLGANWEWANEECVVTASSPGDDVDNDCDGQVDEDNCTAADLKTNFTSEQNSSGHVSYRTFGVRGAGYVNITIITCDIAMLVLRMNSYDDAIITVQVQLDLAWSQSPNISPSMIVAEICITECFEAQTHALIGIDCTAEQTYSIEWFTDSVGLKHVFHTAGHELYWDVSGVFDIKYDELILSAFGGTADFSVGLSEKDCNKVISGVADMAGLKFVLPVEDTDEYFTILLYTRNDLASAISIEIDVATSLSPITMGPSQTVTIEKSDVTAPAFSRITLTAVGGEVPVYLLRSVSGKSTGLNILPVDILGPSYHIFQDSSIDTTSNTEIVCDVFATERRALLSNGQSIPMNGHSEITIGDESATENGLLNADRPLSVFCGTFDDNLVQMPPRETLGRKFYIPGLDLDSINADAEINIVVTEDSTVLTIRGDYDQMDPLDFTGDVYIRPIIPNTIYGVLASKPVQVHLQMRSAVDGWASAVVIPPVEQYKPSHVFPGLSPSTFEFKFSSAVLLNGTEIPSQVTSDVFGADTATTFVYPEGPVFSLTVVSYLALYPGQKLVIPSDVLYGDMNEICVLTVGYPGDGIDNDCDGLIDEEHCSDNKEPGTIDYDLDGALNEDCSNGTNATLPTAQLIIPLEIVTCAQNVTNEEGIIVINSTSSGSADLSSIGVPNIPVEGTEPTYAPLTSTPTIVAISTTTPPPGSTVPPEETCVTDCVCPCGWVYPAQNFTQEELDAVVEAIQDKLRVSKASLSSTIRKKTSATDDRPSATAVGYIGLVFLIVTVTAVALLDITALFRDVRTLMDNVRQVFQP